MKSYTNLEQSKKLAEFLPLESADSVIVKFGDREGTKTVVMPKETFDVIRTPFSDIREVIPCWSLAALLSVLPFHFIVDNQRYEFSMKKGLDKNGETYAIKYVIFNTTFYFHITDYYNNPIDACYEMILKLHEQKML